MDINCVCSYCLKQRTFRTLDFYRKHQDVITPAGLAFHQSQWDQSVTDTFHQLFSEHFIPMNFLFCIWEQSLMIYSKSNKLALRANDDFLSIEPNGPFMTEELTATEWSFCFIYRYERACVWIWKTTSLSPNPEEIPSWTTSQIPRPLQERNRTHIWNLLNLHLCNMFIVCFFF